MMGLFGIVFAVIFVLAFVNIARGIWTTSRLSNKVFDLVEQQLDQHLATRGEKPADSTKLKCEHCGRLTEAAEKCPNCGASL